MNLFGRYEIIPVVFLGILLVYHFVLMNDKQYPPQIRDTVSEGTENDEKQRMKISVACNTSWVCTINCDVWPKVKTIIHVEDIIHSQFDQFINDKFGCSSAIAVTMEYRFLIFDVHSGWNV